MKIAFLLGSLNRGGTETLVLDMLRNVENKQFEPVCFYRKGGELENDFHATGKKVLPLSVSKNPLKYIYQLRRALKSEKIQLVHAQQFIDAFFAFFACLGSDIKIVQTFHGYDYDSSRAGALLLGFIIHRTGLNIFVSRTIADYYTRKYRLKPKNLSVVYNGIGFSKFQEEPADTSLRDELKLPSTTLLLGTVGNFVPVRDPLTVCRFLALLQKKAVDFHFVFAGKKSEQHPEIYKACVTFCKENGLETRVHFPGSRNDIPQLLPQLDAFIYSTDHDTFGIAVIEAIYAGIPVFVNDKEVMLEVTENGKLATLYNSGNEQDLLLQFSDFLLQPSVYKQKAWNASSIVVKKYSIEQHIAALKTEYMKLISEEA